MDTKYAIVVDEHGDKVEFVVLETAEENGITVERPHAYSLKQGETLIFNNIPIAMSMLKPRWTGSNWEETATSEEIEASKLSLARGNQHAEAEIEQEQTAGMG